jgi:shikimate kinase
LAPTLILIGFMGSGKTAVGNYLARGLGWDFFDADPMVEEQAGASIAEIFKQEGEAAFRRAEEGVVLGLLDEADVSSEGTVVSLGGGAVTIPAVAERLRCEPLVFLLDEDVNRAYARARRSSRPLARDADEFRRLYAQREKLYLELARYVVDTKENDVKTVADEIVMVLRRLGVAGIA